MPPQRPADDDPLVDLTLPRRPWWRELAARGRSAWPWAARWTWGLFTLTLATVAGTLISAYLLSH